MARQDYSNEIRIGEERIRGVVKLEKTVVGGKMLPNQHKQDHGKAVCNQ